MSLFLRILLTLLKTGLSSFLCVPIEPYGFSITAPFAHYFATHSPLPALKNPEGKKTPIAKLFSIVFLATNAVPNIIALHQ